MDKTGEPCYLSETEMDKNTKSFFTGILLGAILAGSIVFLLMNRELKKERYRSEIGEELLNAAIKQIPQPPFPPTPK